MSRTFGYWMVALGSFAIGGATCGSAGLYSGYSLAQPEIKTFNYLEHGFEGMCVDHAFSRRDCAVDYDENGSIDHIEVDTEKHETTKTTDGIDTCVMKDIKRQLRKLEPQKESPQY